MIFRIKELRSLGISSKKFVFLLYSSVIVVWNNIQFNK